MRNFDAYLGLLGLDDGDSDALSGVMAALDGILRTGWVMRGVKNPETVAGHTSACIGLVGEVAPMAPEVDAVRVMRLMAVHDWPESLNGDPVTATLPPEERARAVAEKRVAEESAMREICARFGRHGDRLLSLWREFEEGRTPEAAFARQIDKLQAIIMALGYQIGGESVFASEFIEGARISIRHPVLVRVLCVLEETASVL